MKIKNGWASLGASLVVILLLSGGALFAYATKTPTHPAGHAPSPMDDTGISSTTEASSHSHTENETTHETSSVNESISTSSSVVQEQTDHSQTSETTETETGSSGHTSESGLGGELSFGTVSALSLSPPPGYAVGSGHGEMGLHGPTLTIHIELDHMNPGTRFSLSLVVNGSSVELGTFSTSDEGEAQIDAQYTLAPGTYSIGFIISDISTLQSPFTVLSSDPTYLQLVVPRASPSSSSSTSSPTTVESERVNPVTVGQTQEEDINSAIQSKLIPAVIHVKGSSVNFTVVDPSFNLFVGKLQNGGLQITISAANVTGPRVLLVNLTSAQFLNLHNGTLVVTFDGGPVRQASSVLQVLSPSSSSPLFVLVQTSGGYQLLISIPHFSTHVIQIFSVALTAISSFLSVDGPLLILSTLVVTSVFAAAYARRQRPFR
jgi:hypothetical protein